VVTSQAEQADHMFLLVKGSARYFFITPEGRTIYLLWLTPGEIFGGATLLTEPSLFLVGTETVRDSCVLAWPRKTIRTLAARYPKLLENGLAIATDYLTWYLASHLSLVCHTARQRLAHVLVSLASGIGRKGPDGIDLDITNEQLANTANVTLFTASRLMSEWQRSGAVTKTRVGCFFAIQSNCFLLSFRKLPTSVSITFSASPSTSCLRLRNDEPHVPL